MSDSPKAVFLSYAREDADASRRIAEALLGFGPGHIHHQPSSHRDRPIASLVGKTRT